MDNNGRDDTPNEEGEEEKVFSFDADDVATPREAGEGNFAYGSSSSIGSEGRRTTATASPPTAVANSSCQTSIVGRRLEGPTDVVFQCIKGRSDTARIVIMIVNNSEKQLSYRFKTNSKPDLTALPAASGRVDPHCSTRTMLTWHRPTNYDSWNPVSPPKLFLVTQYLVYNISGELEAATAYKLNVVLNMDMKCAADNPPVDVFILEYTPPIDNCEIIVRNQASLPGPAGITVPPLTLESLMQNNPYLFCLIVLFIAIIAAFILVPSDP